MIENWNTFTVLNMPFVIASGAKQFHGEYFGDCFVAMLRSAALGHELGPNGTHDEASQ